MASEGNGNYGVDGGLVMANDTIQPHPLAMLVRAWAEEHKVALAGSALLAVGLVASAATRSRERERGRLLRAAYVEGYRDGASGASREEGERRALPLPPEDLADEEESE